VSWRDALGERTLTAIARLKDDVSLEAVESALEQSAAAAGLAVEPEPLSSHMAAGREPLALGALVAGLLILVVCGANVLNLFVARGIYRARDFATRSALGASRLDLWRLLLLELLAIGVGAVALSLATSHLTLAAIMTVLPEDYTNLGAIAVDGRVASFAAVAAGFLLLACALPMWLGARLGVGNMAGSRSDEPRGARLWRFALAAGQAGLAVVLLIGASFLVRSHLNLWAQDTGFSHDARLISVSYPDDRNGADLSEKVAATMASLRAVSGVTAAGAGIAVGSLLDGYGGGGGALIRAGRERARIIPSQVTPGFFDVVGTAVLAGRQLTAADRSWEAVLVNQVAASRFWPNLAPGQVIGQSLIVNDNYVAHVVGVVESVYDRALDAQPAPRVYKPLELATVPIRRISYVVRPAQAEELSETAIRRAIVSVDAQAVVEAFDSMAGRLSESVRDRSFATLMLGLFGAAALGVTASGIVAVVAFVTARRTKEIAIRVALGADPRAVRLLVIRDSVTAAVVGSLGGFMIGRWLARAIENQMYGVTAADWAPPSVAIGAVVLVTISAAWWPARRALRLSPTDALRQD
jgi:predicted permease